jgi:hypothetical protein
MLACASNYWRSDPQEWRMIHVRTGMGRLSSHCGGNFHRRSEADKIRPQAFTNTTEAVQFMSRVCTFKGEWITHINLEVPNLCRSLCGIYFHPIIKLSPASSLILTDKRTRIDAAPVVELLHPNKIACNIAMAPQWEPTNLGVFN